MKKQRTRKKLFNFGSKNFSAVERMVYDNLHKFLREISMDYLYHGKGDRDAHAAISLMNGGVFAPVTLPGDMWYVIDKGKIKKSKVTQVDTTITKDSFGFVIFYKTEDGDEQFCYGSEIGKRIFKNKLKAQHYLDGGKK